jgi:hypothetical protein
MVKVPYHSLQHLFVNSGMETHSVATPFQDHVPVQTLLEKTRHSTADSCCLMKASSSCFV